ncbi:hypothetical protein HYH03_006971 [Edaphochlamys debaryana]|uniref:Guanylate cyclase domain-containing protein n=1 Tax=Edaphochlamys debaryana TaxID=47281 RepID=A0A836C109_9CHLO|nr:hypothetical protein HYH03_006971 [Edaphochlamys debaryana]|eukprot:KAG2495039.1 hypothetical protein HYH03_006971 [Edaphochlamys debaryana]
MAYYGNLTVHSSAKLGEPLLRRLLQSNGGVHRSSTTGNGGGAAGGNGGNGGTQGLSPLQQMLTAVAEGREFEAVVPVPASLASLAAAEDAFARTSSGGPLLLSGARLDQEDLALLAAVASAVHFNSGLGHSAAGTAVGAPGVSGAGASAAPARSATIASRTPTPTTEVELEPTLHGAAARPRPPPPPSSAVAAAAAGPPGQFHATSVSSAASATGGAWGTAATTMSAAAPMRSSTCGSGWSTVPASIAMPRAMTYSATGAGPSSVATSGWAVGTAGGSVTAAAAPGLWIPEDGGGPGGAAAGGSYSIANAGHDRTTWGSMYSRPSRPSQAYSLGPSFVSSTSPFPGQLGTGTSNSGAVATAVAAAAAAAAVQTAALPPPQPFLTASARGRRGSCVIAGITPLQLLNDELEPRAPLQTLQTLVAGVSQATETRRREVRRTLSSTGVLATLPAHTQHAPSLATVASLPPHSSLVSEPSATASLTSVPREAAEANDGSGRPERGARSAGGRGAEDAWAAAAAVAVAAEVRLPLPPGGLPPSALLPGRSSSGGAAAEPPQRPPGSTFRAMKRQTSTPGSLVDAAAVGPSASAAAAAGGAGAGTSPSSLDAVVDAGAASAGFTTPGPSPSQPVLATIWDESNSSSARSVELQSALVSAENLGASGSHAGVKRASPSQPPLPPRPLPLTISLPESGVHAHAAAAAVEAGVPAPLPAETALPPPPPPPLPPRLPPGPLRLAQPRAPDSTSFAAARAGNEVESPFASLGFEAPNSATPFAGGALSGGGTPTQRQRSHTAQGSPARTSARATPRAFLTTRDRLRLLFQSMAVRDSDRDRDRDNNEREEAGAATSAASNVTIGLTDRIASLTTRGRCTSPPSASAPLPPRPPPAAVPSLLATSDLSQRGIAGLPAETDAPALAPAASTPAPSAAARTTSMSTTTIAAAASASASLLANFSSSGTGRTALPLPPAAKDLELEAPSEAAGGDAGVVRQDHMETNASDIAQIVLDPGTQHETGSAVARGPAARRRSTPFAGSLVDMGPGGGGGGQLSGGSAGAGEGDEAGDAGTSAERVTFPLAKVPVSEGCIGAVRDGGKGRPPGQAALGGSAGAAAGSVSYSGGAANDVAAARNERPSTATATCGVGRRTPLAPLARTSTVAGGAAAAGACAGGRRWHKVSVVPCVPANPEDDLLDEQAVYPNGRPLTITVTQIDVTEQVEAQTRLASLLEQEHKVLESIYPRHVIEYLLQQGGLAGPAAAQQAGPGRGGGGGGGGSLLGSTLAPGSVQRMASLATWHPGTTILFADIVGFTSMCHATAPLTVMAFLNALYSRFDAMIDIYKVYKVETIGDCYMVAGGVVAFDDDGYKSVISGQEDPLHAVRVMEFAKAMLRTSRDVRMPHTGEPVMIRIGLHTGPVTSGVVGDRMPRFCLFGDTVNTASRMESTCRPGQIHVSDATRQRLPSEAWRDMGMTNVKGKGEMRTYEWAGDVDAPFGDKQLQRLIGLYL